MKFLYRFLGAWRSWVSSWWRSLRRITPEVTPEKKGNEEKKDNVVDGWRFNGRTRYYTFTRVNPKCSDFELLVSTCERIDAHLGYLTIPDDGKIRLVGFIVLRGPETVIGDIEQLFPNFNLTPMEGTSFDGVVSDAQKKAELIGAVLVTHNCHPFEGIKRALFHEEWEDVASLSASGVA
jgi:hypothetical protein